MLSARNEGALFFNVQAESYFAQYPKLDKADVGGLINGTNKIQVVECGPWEVGQQLLEIYNAQRASPTLTPISIFVDEAHLICGRGNFNFPDGAFDKESIAAVLCTTGLRWNLRMVWITQRPQFCDSGIFRTARFHIFFTVSEGDITYFERNNITFTNPEWHDWVMVRT